MPSSVCIGAEAECGSVPAEGGGLSGTTDSRQAACADVRQLESAAHR
ncbi:hypothetical protein [Streptomyces sp. NRRL S-37]|nr:hypothetical protein [Streptomyces sp. NRRL S-37]